MSSRGCMIPPPEPVQPGAIPVRAGLPHPVAQLRYTRPITGLLVIYPLHTLGRPSGGLDHRLRRKFGQFH
jgi:hypothetical protein